MAERRAPGVFVEEVRFASSPIQGVSTSTVGFVGVTGRGPLLGPLTSFADFERATTPNFGVYLPLAVRGFFENGGQRCFLSQIAATDPLESGLAALDAPGISVICCPDDPTIQNAAAAFERIEEEGWYDGYEGNENENPYRKNSESWRTYERGYNRGVDAAKVEIGNK